MDWNRLANQILNDIGGQTNIKYVTHCATRLRFKLYDLNQVQVDKIDNLSGVLGVVKQGGQLQIIIGNDVSKVYDSFTRIFKNVDINSKDAKNENFFTAALDTINGIFLPIIPAMAGLGILKALLSVISMLGLVSTTSQTYQIFNFVSNTIFYFLPILLAHSASVKFKTNPYISMVLGAMLINPSFVQMLSQATKTHTVIHLLGLPVTNVNYTSSVVPIILIIWVMSYIEPAINKIVPKTIRIIVGPLLILLIITPLSFIIIAPIGSWLGNLLIAIIELINRYAGWTIPLIIGTLGPLIVMTGMHYALISVAVNSLAKVGWENIFGPGMLVSNIAQGGSVFAVAVQTKNCKLKALGISTGISALLGITEPALYGINLRYKRPLISSMIGGGLGGLFLGIMNVKRFQQIPPGLLSLPGFVGKDFNNMLFAILGLILSFFSSFIIQLFLGLSKN